ncbi:MAG: hypothetical protein JRC58_09385, partial [Deltaproteobacteria bacterium]|nr:hypothetical protein [Deltaproteobacteria bacterium]
MKLYELSIQEAHRLLRKKEISSQDLTRAILDRINAVDENGVITTGGTGTFSFVQFESGRDP